MNNLNHSRRLATRLFAAGLLLASAASALAEVRYVDVNSTNATLPYTNWITAATNIQDAVDAAVAGDEILVANGIYAAGGRTTVADSTINRVAVDKPLSLRSINGPQVTTINGGWSVRCAYLTNGASLSGFTLTNGFARFGGGLFSESTNAVVSNCVVSGNSAGGFGDGGGAYGSTLNNCSLSGNTASGGGGGGAAWGKLNNCTLMGNSAGGGGGASDSLLNNCTLAGNWAQSGGGADWSTLNNCTLTGNSASDLGGGADLATLNNCIVYFNTAPQGANYSDVVLNYCCTTPQPPNGVGDISLDPQLASPSRLSAGSPCRGAGSAAYVSGTDIDGELWASPPSIGCDEYHAGALTGPLSVAIKASLTNVVAGYTAQLTALIEGQAAASSWDFGDGTAATNQPYTSHAWTAPGDYTVFSRAYNESQPGGVSATVTVHVVAQPVHYVAAGSANPIAPYASWATAAINIQDAVDAVTLPGALVLVTNGIYATGGRAAYGTMTNRVAVDKPLTLRSVNGPQFTAIHGAKDGLGIRCVYLTKGASLSGFTLTNGAAYGDSGGGLACESQGEVVSNCVITGNSAYANGGGGGGGAAGGTLNNCSLTGNSADVGGGAFDSTLNNCTLAGNSAQFGGGAYLGTLNNCTISGNSSSGPDGGGGAGDSTLNNCTVTDNSAAGMGPFSAGGGAAGCTLNNCIVYFNTAPRGANYSGGTLKYCCTTPQPTNGVGNITLDPQLASSSRLSAASPCRGAGSSAYASGTDIDGESWSSPPSIGCDEYHAGALTGPLSVAITESLTNVLIGFTVQFTALIAGRPTGSSWDFGDGITVTNQPYTSHAWTAQGDYAVILRAFNESQAGGIRATVTIHVVTQPVHYVVAGNANPATPYTSWVTAATNIQDAVDAATVPGALVLVTNGIYAPMRVGTDKLLTVLSVNGPQFTSIDGRHAARCVYLTNGTSVSGFTLTNGFILDANGAGVFCASQTAVVSNCVIAGNSAYIEDYGGAGGGASGGTLYNCTLIGNTASYCGGAYNCTLNNCTLTGNVGGGAAGGTLNNCTLTGNSTASYGGGASYSTLNNCTLTGNSASDLAGGAYGSTLNNCIVYFNTAPQGANYFGGTLNYCCTTPLPTNGLGNIINAPLFVDLAAGNLRLQANSPCINASLNALAPAGPDLDGNPRIKGGTVDVGAYEYQAPASIISYAWLQQYGLPIDGSADTADPDGDGVDNFHEWLAGTDPTNTSSSPAQLTITPSGASVILAWSTNAVGFTVQSTTNLVSPAWETNSPVPVVIAGQNVLTNPISGPRQFYRLSY